MVLITFITTASLPLSSIATRDIPIKSEGELREECSYEITSINECLEKELKASEVKLKHI